MRCCFEDDQFRGLEIGHFLDTPAELLPPGQFERVIEEEILARPWFTRVWILQELFLSQDPWLQCGKSRVRWNVFCKQVMASNSSSWKYMSRFVLENMRNSRSKFRVTNESIPDRPKKLGPYLFELLSMQSVRSFRSQGHDLRSSWSGRRHGGQRYRYRLQQNCRPSLREHHFIATQMDHC
ncbi:hypothetical protein B0O99DRAFT_731908 [Bisporella sp. PMI_857]|nr:hypothetical protein B0O99DRAFT_731908 [Bisporella sp. PMI_857]